MPAKPGPLRPHEERPSFARREPREPPPGEPKPGDSFLIVAEGGVTERLYFEGVRSLLQISPVTVRLVHPCRTDAEGLVRTAMFERDAAAERAGRRQTGNFEIEGYDHIWVLFDTDVAARLGRLGPALELARAQGIRVGHSTPSMEFWLLLHFRFTTGPLLNSRAAEQAVAAAWGQAYDKRQETFQKLWPAIEPGIPAAVSRAPQVREYHQKGGAAFPANPSTELDLLVRALDAAVAPPMRILG